MTLFFNLFFLENFSHGRKGESSGVTSKDSIYQTETAEECTFSSSIHYGGQENYSPTTRTTNESPHYVSVIYIKLYIFQRSIIVSFNFLFHIVIFNVRAK